MTHTPLAVRQLTPTASAATLSAAAGVLEASFEGSELSAVLKGNDPELSAARALNLVTTSTLDLETYLAETPAGEIVGVMLVKPKGFEHQKSPNAKGPHAQRLDALVDKYPDIQAGAQELKENVSRLKLEAYGPTDITDTVYISHLSVLPAWQGRGVGSTLVRFLLAQPKVAGSRVTLLTTSPRHVAYYERFGFRSLGDAAWKIRGVEVHMWAMAADVADAKR